MWIWTTEVEAGNTFFGQTSVLAPDYGDALTTAQSTRHALTTLAQTTTLGDFYHTVIQADSDEALWYLSNPPETWNGNIPATISAESGTRFTLSLSVNTRQMAVWPAASRATSIVENLSQSRSVSWLSTIIANNQTHTVVNLSVMPNTTRTTATTSLSTATTSRSAMVFSANSVSFGQLDNTVQNFTNPTIATTQSVLSVGFSSQAVFRQIGQTDFQTTVTKTIATTRTILATDLVTLTRSGLTNYGGTVLNAFGNTQTASGITGVAGNATAPQAPYVSIAPSPETSRTNFCSSGAVVGSQKGLWFTAPSSYPYNFILNYVTNGSGRAGRTIFPKTGNLYTISSDSISWKPQGADSTTTLSMVVGVSGQTRPMQDTSATGASIFTQSPIYFGGSAKDGQTFIQVAGPGAYKDQISGTTTSFGGAATLIEDGDSQALRKWQPVTHLSPPQYRTHKQGIAWAVPRNSTALPPNA
jgi:hypothetical protein